MIDAVKSRTSSALLANGSFSSLNIALSEGMQNLGVDERPR